MYVQHQQSVGKNGKKFTKKLLAQKSDSMEPLNDEKKKWYSILLKKAYNL